MNQALLRAALVTSTLAAVLLPVSPASAATAAIPDGTGDVWRSTYDLSTEEEKLEPAGSPVNADLTRTTVKHTRGKVVLVARYAELRKQTNRFALIVELRTNEGLRRDVGVETVTRDGWGGTSFFGSPQRELPCKGLTHLVDYPAGLVKVSVPRSCLSGPRWVQVRSMAMAFEESGNELTTLFDSGQDESADMPRAWSGRVRRG